MGESTLSSRTGKRDTRHALLQHRRVPETHVHDGVFVQYDHAGRQRRRLLRYPDARVVTLLDDREKIRSAYGRGRVQGERSEAR